jgi:hypothetical protein
MKRLIVVLALLGSSACEIDERDESGFTPSGPTAVIIRVEGPQEVRVGEAVQYKAFSKSAISNTELDVTASASFLSTRLTFSTGGRAVGASEGQTEVEAIFSGASSRMTVNVIGAAVATPPLVTPPTTPTPPTVKARTSRVPRRGGPPRRVSRASRGRS